jgi:hypothetical protein
VRRLKGGSSMESKDFKKLKLRAGVLRASEPLTALFTEPENDPFPEKMLDGYQLERYMEQHWKRICLAHNLIFNYNDNCPHCVEAATSAWSEEINIEPL